MLIILVFIILLFLSAFFSSSETAYFNLKKHEYKDDRLKKLLSNPKKLLTFLLIGNTLVNIGIGTIAANYTINVLAKKFTSINQENLLFIEVVVVTILVLIFGEIIPKSYAITYSKKMAKIYSSPIKVIMKILSPISFVFYQITVVIIKLLPFKREKMFDTEEELKMLTEIVEEEGTIEELESDMIQSVFEFNDKLVKEILTPRVDIIAINANSNLDEVMDIISQKKFSKIPIYEENIDNIKGILYAKDIIPYLIGSRPKINLKKLSRLPFFIPETKPIDDLLEEFKNKRTNIAVVVDEWGGTSGLITLEDVVEEIMGELRDPYDHEEYSVIQKNDDTLIIDGAIKIYDLEENIDIHFPDEREYDTLAGFILDSLKSIPKKGEFVEYENYTFKVIQIEQNRIDKVEITRKHRFNK